MFKNEAISNILNYYYLILIIYNIFIIFLVLLK